MAAPPPSSTTFAGAVHRLQEILIQHGAPSERHLFAAASLLSRSDYSSSVVEERTIYSLCGFPLCPRPLPPPSRRGRYRISLREHRIYDLVELSKFCSEQCLIASRAYEASLPQRRSFDLNKAKVEEVLKLFEEVENNGVDLGMSQQLRISEKEGGVKGEVAIEDWIGSHHAIEGYVPKSHRHSGLNPTVEEMMDFRSDIIFGDGTHDFSSFETKDISDQISKKLENIVLDENTNNKKRSKGKKNSSKLPKAIKSDKKLTTSEKRNTNNASGEEEHSKQNGLNLNLKSSLKKERSGLGPRAQNQSVKWADKERALPEEESSEMPDVSSEEGAARSLILASAEACAGALIHAADVVSSGKSETEDAVSEAGIVILPQLRYGTDKEPHQNKEGDTQETERGVTKWPQKPVLLETDEFEVDDSWHDTPPEGFNLDLSPFCTIWMAIFGWVTRSTLCFVYGHEESLSEEFSEVEGREYPRREVLTDGQSAEMKKALDGFVCRALPSLVLDLRLPVPISTLEKYLGRLLETMSFVEAVPALRTRQWQIVVLLFLDALSVKHLPSLSPIIANRILLRKVLIGAQIDEAEYDSMIDIFLPFGRSTNHPYNNSVQSIPVHHGKKKCSH